MLSLEKHNTPTESSPKLNIKGVSNFSALIFSVLLVSPSLRADESTYLNNPIHPFSPLNPIYQTTVDSAPLSAEQQKYMIHYFGILGVILLGTGLYYALSDFRNRK